MSLWSKRSNPVQLASLFAVAGFWAVWPALAQYPGQVAKSTKDAPVLRSIAVLEWTGDLAKPKSARLVPVTLLDAGELQDGSVYLARPVPLALSGDVEYEIQQGGEPEKLFDLHSAGLEMGGWVGHGMVRPLVAAKPKAEEKMLKPIEDENSERPVLHRKHHADDSSDKNKDDSAQTSSSGSAQADDPDRPRLHKKATGDDGDSGKSGDSSAPAQPSDPDRPVLRKKSDDTASSPDADRPTLKKKKKQPEEGSVSSFDSTDPDRPRLKRGIPKGNGLEVPPTLLGLPADMQQAVAVSDAKTRPEHPWVFTWSDPEDEARMKAKLEEIARDALGLTPPPPPPTPTPKRTTAHKMAKPTAPAPPPEPAPLVDEQFRVFELAYGAGATLVLSASNDAPTEQQKFVTLVAQPDLYGNLLVLLKNVTDRVHLDETPRMRLVDAVDAMADNRGELLFELRGASQRQFVLYRAQRGHTEKLFASGEAVFGSVNRE